jgi:hypothetical protein
VDGKGAEKKMEMFSLLCGRPVPVEHIMWVCGLKRLRVLGVRSGQMSGVGCWVRMSGSGVRFGCRVSGNVGFGCRVLGSGVGSCRVVLGVPGQVLQH